MSGAALLSTGKFARLVKRLTSKLKLRFPFCSAIESITSVIPFEEERDAEVQRRADGHHSGDRGLFRLCLGRRGAAHAGLAGLRSRRGVALAIRLRHR